jgi:hypothetical protein
MGDRNRRALAIGLILIVLGVGLLAMQLMQPGFGQPLILFLIGAAFLVGYFIRRFYGLLIPGCILVGLALGSLGVQIIGEVGDFTVIGLGIGFVAIYVIDLLYRRSTHWWPLIPGGILIVVGLMQVLEQNPSLAGLWDKGWPLILVLAGLLVLAGAFGLFGRKKA